MSDPTIFSDAYGDTYGGVGGEAIYSFTERLYRGLPEVYRYLDEQPLIVGPVARPLRAYISAMGDQGAEVERVFDRLDYLGPDEGGVAGETSDLADPQQAEPSWLPWLGQHVGVTIEERDTPQGRRDAITSGISGFRAGTREALAAAARSALVGTQSVTIETHYQGDPFKIRVLTKGSETPDEDAVRASIIRKRAKPAGVLLYLNVFELTWASLVPLRDIWAEWTLAGSWEGLTHTGVGVAVVTGTVSLRIAPSLAPTSHSAEVLTGSAPLRIAIPVLRVDTGSATVLLRAQGPTPG